MRSAAELYKRLGGDIFTHDLHVDIRRIDKKRQLRRRGKHLSWTLELLVAYMGIEESYDDNLTKSAHSSPTYR